MLNGGDTQITSNAGYYLLSWSIPERPKTASRISPVFEIEEAVDPEFHTPRLLYRGKDLSKSMSGAANGVFYYRTRVMDPDSENQSAWSEPLKVEVKHHSLARAFSFLGTGAIVFVATSVLVFAGHNKAKGEGRA